MTKAIRVENADISNYKVIVEVWERNSTGETKVKELPLDYPTFIATEYIHSDKWLVIRENGRRDS